MNKITEVTRRAIFDYLSVGPCSWHGRLDEVEFLRRVFDLKSLPSTDGRFEDAAGDIWQHRINNPGDWQDDWVFYDSRFDLLHGSDESFLRFICETVHPVVRLYQKDVADLVAFYNKNLAQDGWEIAETTRISDKPVYGARTLLEGAGVPFQAAKKVALTLDASYISQQITRMESAIGSDPELAIGTAKEFIETICKTILAERKVSYDKKSDFPKLVKITLETLELVPDRITKAKEAAASIKVLLNNLAAVARHLAELRNLAGTGHGKDATHQGLDARHARLAVGVASTVGVFLFECHQQKIASE